MATATDAAAADASLAPLSEWPALAWAEQMDKAGFEALLRSSAAVAEGRSPPDDLQLPAGLVHQGRAARGATADAAPPSVSEVHDALVGVLLHAAQQGTDAAAVAAQLQPLMHAERAEQVAAVVRQRRSELRAALAGCGIDPAEVVDVQWTRSAIVSSSSHGRRGGQCVVTLTTQRGGGAETGEVQFTASAEELSGLVAELKRAVKQLDHEGA